MRDESPPRETGAFSQASVSGAALLAAASVLAGACGEGAGTADWTVEVDTLPDGAVRVVNHPPEGGIEPDWRLEEELRIGAVEGGGPEAFGRIRGLAVTGDGRVAVLDAQAREVRIFAPDGAHRATYGGQGEGPGELMAPYGLMLGPEGRLWVADHATNRISVFGPETGFVESWPVTITSRAYIWRGIVTRDGKVWKPSTTRDADRDPVLRIYGEGMQPEDTILLGERAEADPDEPAGFFRWEAPDGSARGANYIPYYPQGLTLLDPRGVIWSTDGGDPTYRIKRWRPGGDTTLVLVTRRRPIPVTEAERDSAIAGVKRSLERFGVTDLDWSRIPHVKPAITNMFLAVDGELWVEIPGSDSAAAYDVYGRDGRHRGTAVSSIRPRAGRGFPDPVVRDGRMWAVVQDELGVQHLLRWAIVPAAGEDGS